MYISKSKITVLLNSSQMRDDEYLDVKKQPLSYFECGNTLQV